MKIPAVLCVLAAAAFAQEQGRAETAADLFYKAFWLEQADGDPAGAFVLYDRVVQKHATCSEAPRAVLGMARIDHAKGKQVIAYLKLLEAKYPGAKRELREVRRLVTARAAAFVAAPDQKDSPLIRKIKACYSQLSVPLPDGNRNREFLIEVQETAHPMLAASLRRDRYDPVYNAAGILVAQKSKAAYAILEAALRDGNVIFKTAIVHALKGVEVDSPDLARALVAIYARSTPALRETIVSTMVRMTRVEGATRAIAYELCAKALLDKEVRVRKAAAAGSMTASYAPDGYIAARLDRMDRNDPFFADYDYAELPRLANRKAHAARARAVLARHRFNPNYRFISDPGSVQGADLLASVAVEWHSQRPDLVARSALEVASRYSPEAVAFVLERAVDAGQARMAWDAAEGMRRAIYPNKKFSFSARPFGYAEYAEQFRGHLGAGADRVARHALQASFAEQDPERRRAAATVLAILGLGRNAEALLVELRRANPQSPLPPVVFSKGTLKELGPERMAAIALLAGGEEDYNRLLQGGVQAYLRSRDYPDRGREFFKVVIPKVGPAALGDLNYAAGTHAALVARKFLVSKGAEWKWDKRGGPVWNSSRMIPVCKQPALLSLILQATCDSRLAVAETAIAVAAQLPTEAATQALVRGLEAPTAQLRSAARAALARRGDQGIDLLIEKTRWEQLDVDELSEGLALIGAAGRQPRHRDYLRGLLDKQEARWADAWPAYFDAAPREAVELALKSCRTVRDHRWRFGALEVLTRTSDPRRIEVFRALLEKSDQPKILHLVVKTASDQYLIELGPEVLRQLRSPHDFIRAAATKAIERLKFYADAQRTFSEQGRRRR